MITEESASASGLFNNLVAQGVEVLPIVIYVWDEYKVLYEHLEKSCQPHGAIVTGTPGIGKSVFNVYALVRRLSAQKPTIFVANSRQPYIFNEGGVYNYSTKVNPLAIKGSQVWCLHDSPLNPEESGAQPDPYFWKFFLVLTVSPDWGRYSVLEKEKRISCWYMNPWSREELRIYFQHLGKPFDKTLFHVFGAVIRHYIDANDASQATNMSSFKMLINEALAEMCDVSRCEKIMHQDDNPTLISHKLFTLRRDEDSKYTCSYGFSSNWVREQFRINLRMLEHDECRSLFRVLGRSGTVGGDIFEDVAKEYLSGTLPNFQTGVGAVLPMSGPGPHWPLTRPGPTLRSGSSGCVMLDPDLKGRVKGQGFEIFSGPGLTWFGPGRPSCCGFNVPASPTNPLFDAIVFEREGPDMILWVFQITVSPERSKGSNQGYQILEEFQKQSQEVIGSGGVVTLRYVLVQLTAKYEAATVYWEFPQDLVEKDPKPPKRKRDPQNTSTPKKHKFIPGDVFVQCLHV
ncbi:hypothetical protein K435DRAFT_869573 [Dendrothele bispora CBS 962.96]|uniref:Uncharacterized protein n=1 Tax=Dendrothele bispora (strain CBS 962.96) TaxID=1314807 RepID=A0A4S8L8W9_DENBC|nr:hypothetical protein K435DRAFT_869573 [Dendrothele bispora CBS 962.96]